MTRIKLKAKPKMILIPCLYMAAGFFAYSTATTLWSLINDSRHWLKAPLAGLCAVAFGFIVVHAQTLQAGSDDMYISGLKFEYTLSVLALVFLVWFIAEYVSIKSKAIPILISVAGAVVIAINFYQPYSIQFDNFEGVYRQNFAWGESVTRGMGTHGAALFLGLATSWSTYGFVIYAISLRYRRSHYPEDLLLLICSVIYVLTGVEGGMVRAGALNFVQLGPFGLLAMVLAVSHGFRIEVKRRTKSEIKLASSLLRDRNSMIESLFDHASYAIGISKDGKIEFANRAFLDLFGYQVGSQAIGDDLINTVAPESRAMVIDFMARRSQGFDVPTAYEVRGMRKDGSVFDMEVNANYFKFNGETFTTGMLRDITASKKAEEFQRIAATAFETQQALKITDANCAILQVNKAFTEITGYSAEDVIGSNPRLLQSGHHDPAFYKSMWKSINKNGSWQGEIWNKRKSGEIYPEWLTISAVKDESGIVTHYVGASNDISERKAAEQRIEELAFYDALTGLPNRTLLRVRLQQALAIAKRRKCLSALLHIDLDNLKSINDTLGHALGDRIIQEMGVRVLTCARSSDTLARIGGDDFILLLAVNTDENHDPLNQAKVIAERILDALRQPFTVGESIHRSSASIGISLIGDGDYGNVDEPLKKAEMAMYQAKSSGRNTFHFYDEQMQAKLASRTDLEARLHEALAQSHFVIHYQPQVNARGLVTGAEALVRWVDPIRGMVSPAEFIPVAEQCGLIIPLGQWILHRACMDLARFARDVSMEHLTVAVNVSARQFRQHTFVEDVLEALRSTGTNPERLKLELTESMLADDIEGVISKMNALRSQGVSFSLDDFGTGYSSLIYLKRLPLDQLKIDQGFVRDILIDTNDAAIAKTVIALAESMGLTVIAEGVETVEQRDFLANAKCDAYQGYLFGKPLPVDGFEAVVKSDLTSGITGRNSSETLIAETAKLSYQPEPI